MKKLSIVGIIGIVVLLLTVNFAYAENMELSGKSHGYRREIGQERETVLANYRRARKDREQLDLHGHFGVHCIRKQNG